MKKVGFVALVGRPNVGKSTLLNALINFNLAITAASAQTTRNVIKGIFQDNEAQIVFIDTPGVHKPQHALNEALNAKVLSALKDVELVCFLHPINEAIGSGDQYVINLLAAVKHRVAIITKLDLADASQASARAQELKALGFKDVLGVSQNVQRSYETVIQYVKEVLPFGKAFYDDEAVTDLPMRNVAAEIIRGAALSFIREELPHALAVKVEGYEMKKVDDLRITASLVVERDSQKAILIGKNGAMIKKIGTLARQELTSLTGAKVFLDLKVIVIKNWTHNAKFVEELVGPN